MPPSTLAVRPRSQGAAELRYTCQRGRYTAGPRAADCDTDHEEHQSQQTTRDKDNATGDKHPPPPGYALFRWELLLRWCVSVPHGIWRLLPVREHGGSIRRLACLQQANLHEYRRPLFILGAGKQEFLPILRGDGKNLSGRDHF